MDANPLFPAAQCGRDNRHRMVTSRAGKGAPH
jgi:hypothetical protein